MSGLTILTVAFVAYALLAGRLDRLSVTAPMVFVAVGGILGPGGADLLKVSLSNETTLAITEITLALLLFADASTVRIRDVEGDAMRGVHANHRKHQHEDAGQHPANHRVTKCRILHHEPRQCGQKHQREQPRAQPKAAYRYRLTNQGKSQGRRKVAVG